MTDVLAVGLESWIIQDENYGDFQQGQRAAFALEFWALETFTISGAKQAPRSLRHIAGAQYEVSGQVVFSAARWWVIDAGVLLFCEERPPAEASPGGWLTGTIGASASIRSSTSRAWLFSQTLPRSSTIGRSTGSTSRPHRSWR